MDQYSSNLRSALRSIKEGLKLNVTAAQEEIKQPGAEAARKLPDLPKLPEGDIDKLLTPVKGLGFSGPVKGGAGAGAGAGGRAGGSKGEGSSRQAAPAMGPPLQGNPGSVNPVASTGEVKARAPAAPVGGLTAKAPEVKGLGFLPAAPVGGLTRNPDLDAPEIEEAMKLYQRLFPPPSSTTSSTSSSTLAQAPNPASQPSVLSDSATPQLVQLRPVTPLIMAGAGSSLVLSSQGGYLTPLDPQPTAAVSSSILLSKPRVAKTTAGAGKEEEEEDDDDDREVVIRGDDDDDDGNDDEMVEAVEDAGRFNPSPLPSKGAGVEGVSSAPTSVPKASSVAQAGTTLTPQKLKARLPQGIASPGGLGGGGASSRQTPPRPTRRPLSAGKKAGLGNKP